jgi:hypothetical protein
MLIDNNIEVMTPNDFQSSEGFIEKKNKRL